MDSVRTKLILLRLILGGGPFLKKPLKKIRLGFRVSLSLGFGN